MDPSDNNNQSETTKKALEGALVEAESFRENESKFKDLFEKASRKARNANPKSFRKNWAYLNAMIRLLRAFYTREYRNIPWQSISLIIGAIIYFVSPVDVIPDVLPIVGFVDDAAVISWVLLSVRDDLDTFMAWEEGKSGI